MVDEVLAGRRCLRGVATSPVFAVELRPLVERFAERYERLSEEEWRRLAEQGERQLAEERERLEPEHLEWERAERERNSR